MANSVLCDLCGRTIPPHAHYVVRIEVFADPQMPNLTAEDLENLDFQKVLAELIDQMKTLSADDLQDQVYRQFEYRLCRPCQIRFLANPLGKPREQNQGRN